MRYIPGTPGDPAYITKRAIVTYHPKPQKLGIFCSNEESDGPLVGATGTILSKQDARVVMEWDNDNPICRGYDVSNGSEKRFVNITRYKIITEEDYQRRKLPLSDYGLKKYIKDIFDVDITHTNMRLVAGRDRGMSSDFTKSYINNTIFLGCRFTDATFYSTDLDSCYFINCLFTGLTRRYEMKPFRNHVFVNCGGLPYDVNDVPEIS